MYIRRTIAILISFICCLLTFSIKSAEDNIGVKPAVYVEQASDEVVKRVEKVKKINAQYVPDNADIIISDNALSKHDGYHRVFIAYSPVVVHAHYKWVEKSEELDYYGTKSKRTYKISLMELVEAYNKSSDSSWASELGFNVKEGEDVKLYIPSKDSYYRRVVIDSLIESFREKGKTVEYAAEQVYKFIDKCGQEIDLASLIDSFGSEDNILVIAPECFTREMSTPMYDGSACQINMYLYVKDNIDEEKAVNSLLSGGLSQDDFLYSLSYRNWSIKYSEDHIDILSKFNSVAQKVSNNRLKWGYESVLGENYWVGPSDTTNEQNEIYGEIVEASNMSVVSTE